MKENSITRHLPMLGKEMESNTIQMEYQRDTEVGFGKENTMDWDFGIIRINQSTRNRGFEDIRHGLLF